MFILSLVLGLGLALSGATEGRTASAILQDYDAVPPVVLNEAAADKTAAIQEYRRALTASQERKGALARELLDADPGHDRLPPMLVDRWLNTMMSPATAPATIAEIDRAITHFHDPAKVKLARQFRVIATINSHKDDPQAALPELDRYIADYRSDGSAANLLNGFALSVDDRVMKRMLLDRLIAEYPSSPFTKGARQAMALLKQIGKPVSLDFKDAIKGTSVSMADLKGKVVVVDFWATWCAPCVAEMPRMKAIYSRFKDQGVEFIGVSLDNPEVEGGLAKLKAFVAKNEIAWPQRYDGLGWESPVVAEFGVESVPAVFLIDASGNLAELDARGKLETLLPAYLHAAKSPTTTRPPTDRGAPR